MREVVTQSPSRCQALCHSSSKRDSRPCPRLAGICSFNLMEALQGRSWFVPLFLDKKQVQRRVLRAPGVSYSPGDSLRDGQCDALGVTWEPERPSSWEMGSTEGQPGGMFRCPGGDKHEPQMPQGPAAFPGCGYLNREAAGRGGSQWIWAWAWSVHRPVAGRNRAFE